VFPEERIPGRVEPDGEHPDGRRRPLMLTAFKIRHFKRFSEQFSVDHIKSFLISPVERESTFSMCGQFSK
jgi:hypothetical protein